MARGFRESVAFDQDCCLGGNEAEAWALDASQPLELNGVTFSGKDGKDFTLATLDALYPGALAGMFDPAQHIFCASHTHYAPMIDANKGLVGRYSQESCERWKLAFAERTAATGCLRQMPASCGTCSGPRLSPDGLSASFVEPVSQRAGRPVSQ